jgi:hypothetical protein
MDRLMGPGKEQKIGNIALWFAATTVKTEIADNPHPVATHSTCDMLLSLAPGAERLCSEVSTRSLLAEKVIQRKQDLSFDGIATSQSLLEN